MQRHSGSGCAEQSNAHRFASSISFAQVEHT
jgi:hypothetical protein